MRHRKISQSKNISPFKKDKLTLGTLTVDSNNDKSISLLLDRNKITRSAKVTANQNKIDNPDVVSRNIKCIQNCFAHKSKVETKV